MGRQDVILKAVERIHEATFDRDGWRAALGTIAKLVRADHAFVVVQNLRTGCTEWTAAHDIPPDILARVGVAVDTGRLPDWAPSLAAGTVIASSSMATDRDFARSRFYNETIRPIGDFYGLALSPLRDRHRQAYLAVGRRLGREDYDARDRGCLQALAPHIRASLRMGSRLAQAEMRLASLDAALGFADIGVFLVDAAASLVFANGPAEQLLSAGHLLRLEGEALATADPSTTRELRRLVWSNAGLAQHPQPGHFQIDGTERGDRSCKVLVAPFRPAAQWEHLAFGRRLALVLASDPEKVAERARQRLRHSFGLTPVEALVAVEMTTAKGRAASAARLGISEATLKTHLVHIFEKTGVGRQAELVRLVLDGDG